MKKIKVGSCTTILVGRKASIDGSTMIARNEDGSGDAAGPKKFVVVNPEDQPRKYQSAISKVKIDLPDNPLRYTSTPDVNDEFGIWAESGINSENIAMSETETSTTNSRVLGIDPLVETGIGEEDMLTIVLPYIHSAREGVQRLGALLGRYGTYESNGIAFSDQNEVWYLETIGGHHFAAIKIPDEAYVVAPNRFNIDFFDFESDDVEYSPDLPELIEQYHLNPDEDITNLRHIFGSSTTKDAHYNNPRTWYGQRYFNPTTEQAPEDQNLPFAVVPEHKISVEDVKWVLSSHYQDTPFDPYGSGTQAQREAYRPIGINRNQESHILQIRPDVDAGIAGIHWLAFGPNTFNELVPFYANVQDTPARYRDTTSEYNLNQIFWLNRSAGIFGDTNYHLFSDLAMTTQQKIMAACRQIIVQTDQQASSQADLSEFLQNQNQMMAELYFKEMTAMFGKMHEFSASTMKLRYNLND